MSNRDAYRQGKLIYPPPHNIDDTYERCQELREGLATYVIGLYQPHYQVPAIPTTLDVVTAYPATNAAYQFISLGVHGIANTRRHTI